MKMLTIGEVARKSGLSRSTLLYYDSIGLLKPGKRSNGGYRLYSGEALKRLEKIKGFRRAGLGLKEVAAVLDAPVNRVSLALQEKLLDLNRQIMELRQKQRFIAGMLGNENLLEGLGCLDRKTWTGLLRASGMSDEEMLAWHAAFERKAPEKHREFLEYLGMPNKEIKKIRSLGMA